MAIRRTIAEFSDDIATADIADDAITGGKLANDIAISTTGNIATTGSGTLAVAGTSTLSAGLTVDGATVFNEASADVDFRVESNGNANMLVVDAGNDRVGIGTSAPAHTLDIVGNTAENAHTHLRLFNNDVATTGQLLQSADIDFSVGDEIGTPFKVGKIRGYKTGDHQGAGSEYKGGLSFWTESAQTLYQRMTITDTGNVGIGDVSPQGVLEVNNRNTATGCALFIKGGEDDLSPISGQYTGIGFGYGAGDTYNNTAIIHEFTNASAVAKLHLCVGNWANQGTADLDDACLTVSSNGDVSIGTKTSLSSGCKLSISQNSGSRHITTRSYSTASHNHHVFENNSGQNRGSITVTTTATAYNTSSDYRLKENIIAMTDAISRLKNLKPSRFNFIINPNTTIDGFIAHEASAVVPEAVTGEKDAMIEAVLYVEGDELPEGKNIGDVKEASEIDPQGIDQGKLVPLLVGALQEAIAKIETLETTVTTLEAVENDSSSSNAALEARIIALEAA